MKKFVLIAVLLQLCLSVLEVNAGGEKVNEDELKFGDLIEFPQIIMVNKPVYSHYGIYVGLGNDDHFEGKEDDQNIFEMTRDPPGCRFSKKTGPFTRANDYYNNPKQEEAKMKATIKDLMRPNSGKCKEYSLNTENCEMVATLVRYGKAMCQQKNTIMAGAAKLTKPRKKRHEASAAA